LAGALTPPGHHKATRNHDRIRQPGSQIANHHDGHSMKPAKPLMMESMLKHMVELTGHRDHNLLDVSVITALYELVGASQARVLEMFKVRGEAMVRPRVWIKGGKLMPLDEGLAPDQGGEAMALYPVLVDCIARQLRSAEEIDVNGSHVLWVPLWQNDTATATMQICSDTQFASNTLDVMEGILSVYRNYQNLLDYSERDSLTGLLNRKTFDEKFSKMVSYNAQPETQLPDTDGDGRRQVAEIRSQWLAVVDIDHFKRVNDQFGHLYGDEVLILVANVLRSSFRAQDRVFRFGGEEFVVLLRSSSLDDARKAFERFRSNIEAHNFPQVGTVTVSVGFVNITGETPVVILGHADQALYYGKTHGRNQVCYYDELVSNGLLHSEVANDSVEFFFDDLAES
jgi:diguanylate cyclase (GGDEF)-like protein